MTRDLVVCSLEAWDGVWRRNQFLVRGLLERDPDLRVLFVEPSADPIHALSQRRRPSRPRGLVRVDAATAGLAPGAGDGRLWAYQQAKLAPRRVGSVVDAALDAGVRRAARKLKLTDPVLWVNDPGRAPLVRRSGWPALYDITDDWALAARSPRERDAVLANEQLLLAECRAVVACSAQLQRDKSHQRAVELIPNAVEVARYRTACPRPADLPRGGIALYAGTLHEDRLDVELVLRAADALGAMSAAVVLVGPDALSAASRARLAAHPAIRLLGPRPYPQVPGYLQHADVLVVPHVVDPFTDSLDPIKLYEYQAVGRPVLATPVAGFRDAGPPVRLAAAAEFPARLAELVRESPASVVVAGVPDWSQRVEQFAAVVAGLG